MRARKFGVHLAVRLVAARRDIDIVQFHAIVIQPHAHMARLAIGLPIVAGGFGDGNARDRGHAVIALLPMHRLIRIAQIGKILRREQFGHGLDFL